MESVSPNEETGAQVAVVAMDTGDVKPGEGKPSKPAKAPAQAKKPSAQKSPGRPKRGGPRPMPALKAKVELNTAFAQRVYNRTWDTLKGHLYTVTMTTRAVGLDEAAALCEEFIDQEMSKAEDDLGGEIARADELMAHEMIEGYASYAAARKIETEFTTPQAKRYLNLIVQIDQLIMRLDVLYLSGVIDAKNCKGRSHEWQSRLVKMANRLREKAGEARRGMDRIELARAATNDTRQEAGDAGEGVPSNEEEQTPTAEETPTPVDVDADTVVDEATTDTAAVA